MADNEEWLPGTFWLAEHPDSTVHGRLYLSEDLRLELEGSLTPAMEEWTETDNVGNVVTGMAFRSEELGPLTVLGNLRDRQSEVSLFECITVGRSGDIFMATDSAQTVRPLYGLRGGHVSESSGITGVRVELQHAADWSRAAGFGMTVMNDGEHTLTYKDPVPETATLVDGGVVQLCFATKMQRPGPAGGSFSRTVAIEVDGFPAVSYRNAERKYSVPLASLVTLCLLKPATITRYYVRQGDGGWLEAVSSSLAATRSSGPSLKPWDLMLTLPDIGIEGVARWLDQVETLGPLPPVVANAAGSRSIQLETTLFDLTSVAEGLHARKFEKLPGPVDKATARRIRDAVETHLSECGFDVADIQVAVDCLGGMTRPAYRDRLAQLKECTGDTVIEVFGNDFELWSKAVAACRNGLAHRNLDFITPESSGLYAAVVYSLRWFLIAVLLLETGITREALRDKIRQKQAYGQFVKQAPGMLPEIYGDVATESNDGPETS